MNSDSIDKPAILHRLETKCFGRSLVLLDECTSTNDVAARIAEEGAPHGAVVIAETQLAGRGRHGRSWYSSRGGVWMSVLLKPEGRVFPIDSFPIIAAVAIAKTMVLRWGIRAGVRWPNDVVIDGRKVAGILVESKSKGNELTYAAIGVGINANVDTGRVESIRESSTSINSILNAPIDRVELIVAVLSSLEAMFGLVQAGDERVALDLLAELDCSRGRRVRVRTVDSELRGSFDSYESLATARIRAGGGINLVDTNAAVSVDYESD